jgi:hypothetical protein
MPSTFTNNGGIELPADGEKDGVWGDVVNLNMQIVDRLTNGVGAVSLTGTTHDLITANGVLSDGQYALVVFGGAPTGTNTVTISPNDAEKVYFIRNATAQSVIMSQGSGGNVTIPAGAGAIVYANGAGTGAAVADLTATFIPDLSLAGITASVAELNLLDGATATTAELNTLDGVTSAIQTQIDTKQVTITGGATTIVSDDLAVSRALVSDGSGKVAVSDVTAAELELLSGASLVVSDVTATAAELNQIDGKSVIGADTNILTTPTITGQALKYLRVNAGETAAEFSAIPTQATATWEAGTDTTESLVSAAKVAAAVVALAPDVAAALNAAGSAPIFAARAWIKFGATGSVFGSGNVSSVTYNGTGDYTVNFTTAMQDTNYAVSATSGADNDFMIVISQTAGSVRVQNPSRGSAINNVNTGHVIVFR